MKHRLSSLGVMGLTILFLAFTWFGQPSKKDAKETKQESPADSSKKSSSTKAAPVSSASGGSGSGSSGGPVKIYSTPYSSPKIYQPPVPIVKPPVQPVSSSAAGVSETVDIIKIQKQIQEILSLNETLKIQHASQAGEIQRITEQAKIHQRLLSDLEGSNDKQKTLTEKDAAEILRQEKIRVIRDETEKNKKFIGDLKQSDQTARAKAS